MRSLMMPAITVEKSGTVGDWNQLRLKEMPRPTPGRGEVLVQVEACSINRADLLQRRGLYPPPPGASEILGLDFAGFVVWTDSRIDSWHAGDRVFGVVAGGGYGRYLTAPAEHLVSVPAKLSFIEAAAVAEVFFTAFLNLFLEADVKAGETLLVHGGGSGVGTAAIQLARAKGVEVIITAGNSEKVDRAISLGASYGVNYNDEDFSSRVLEITRGKGVDVILDCIGASYLARHIKILNSRGRLVIIGLMGGSKSEIDLAPVLSKRLRITGSVLRSRTIEEKAAITQAFKTHVIPLLESGTVRPIIDRIYPIEAVEEAHQYMRDSLHFGKIVLTWQQPGR